MNILVTGSSGFIGFHISKFLLDKNINVIGVDNMNSYYSVKLKKSRLEALKVYKNYKFFKFDLKNKSKLNKIFKKNKIEYVFHLAAQAGVRYSIDNPRKYIDSNVLGFYNILEVARDYKIKRLFYASSSSVYGDSKNFPLKEEYILNPNNPYSLTKKFNEDLAATFNRYYKINLTGIRFFTVYGEWGRPDMFISKIILSKLKNKKFLLNNFGNHSRDFTYIGDVVKILYKMLKLKKQPGNEIVNISSNKPLKLLNVINLIEKYLGKISIIKQKLQLADVIKTHGCNKKIKKITSFKKFSKFEESLKKTIDWSIKYYK